MRELNQDAAALLRSGRAAFSPDASDRARVFESLRQALGDAAVSGESGGATHVDRGASRGPVWKSAWTKLFGAVSVLAVGASVTIAAHPWTKTRANAPAPVAQTSVVEPPLSMPAEDTVAPLADDAPSPPVAPIEPTAAAPRTRLSPSARANGDSLAEEVRLLSAAERELNDGSREETLATLAEHERRFPRGALTEARLAVRAEALCGLGRRAEARADLRKLARAYPASPHLDAARKLCGADIDSP